MNFSLTKHTHFLTYLHKLSLSFPLSFVTFPPKLSSKAFDSLSRPAPIMLQSLVPRSPRTSNPNAMKTKRAVDAGGDSPADEPSFKRTNFSGEKTTAEAEEEQAFDPEPHGGDSTGLKLLGLLLQCAECVAMDNLDFANDLLPEIAELSSPYGTSPERVGAYFAQALQARVLSSCIGSCIPHRSATRRFRELARPSLRVLPGGRQNRKRHGTESTRC